MKKCLLLSFLLACIGYAEVSVAAAAAAAAATLIAQEKGKQDKDKKEAQQKAELQTTFEAIFALREMAAKAADAYNATNQHHAKLNTTEWPEPNPHWTQTSQGLYVACGLHPAQILSPWGSWDLYQTVPSFSSDTFDEKDKAIAIFFGSFKGAQMAFTGIPEYPTVPKPKNLRYFKQGFKHPITEAEVGKLKGSGEHVFTSDCAYGALYEVTAVNGKPLPKPTLLKLSDHNDVKAVKADWLARVQAAKSMPK